MKRAIAFATLAALIGCSSPSSTPPYNLTPGSSRFAEACEKAEDCASLLCVGVGKAEARCSRSCQLDKDCPEAENWKCVSSQAGLVCACRPDSEKEKCGDKIDNDCNGKVDDCRVCDGIAVAPDDPQNCGACGVKCGSGQSCREGKCECTDSKSLACGSKCTDPKTDHDNCGGCGTHCRVDQACTAGKCQCEASGKQECSGTCADLQSDVKNCGACGSVCDAEICASGKCLCAQSGFTACAGVGCVDLMSSQENCGKCGKTCDSTQACINGTCGCEAPLQACGDECVKLQSDSTNCGTCGNICGPGQSCSLGTCRCNMSGDTFCDAKCTNTMSDAKNCGGCGKVCDSGLECKNGGCVCLSGVFCGATCMPVNDALNCGSCAKACAPGQQCYASACKCTAGWLTACPSGCFNTTSDPLNCGGCGVACGKGESCSLGKCQCASSVVCGDTCMPVDDSQNCGACGNACAAGQSCEASKCACLNLAYTACGSECADLQTDAKNCGSCGKVCSSALVCTKGICTCPTGKSWCAASQTCVDMKTDLANCGACGTQCKNTQVCSSGQCTCPSYGQVFCENMGKCISLSADVANCGKCGNVCPGSSICNYGACTCSDSSQTVCSTGCMKLKTDKNNCGGCGVVCPGSSECMAGQCKCPAPTMATPLRLLPGSTVPGKFAAGWSGKYVGVAYSTWSGTKGTVSFVLLNPDGSLAPALPMTILEVTTDVSPPALTWTGSEWAVAWANGSYNNSAFRVQRLSEEGQLIGTPITLGVPSMGTKSNPSIISMPGTGIGVVWRDSSSLRFTKLGFDGTILSGTQLGSLNSATLSAVVGNEWILLENVELSSYAIQRLNADGSNTSKAYALPMPLFSPASLMYDGKTWLFVYTSIAWNKSRMINIARGDTFAMQQVLNPTATVDVGEAVSSSLRGQELVIAYQTEFLTRSTLTVQRWSLPPDPSKQAVPLTDAFLGVTTPTAHFQHVPIHTNPGQVVLLYPDDRWGQPELYSTNFVSTCP